MKYYLILVLTVQLFTQNLFSQNSHADGEMHPAPENGNLIPEPDLSDYRNGYREPGILLEPYESTESEDTSSTRSIDKSLCTGPDCINFVAQRSL